MNDIAEIQGNILFWIIIAIFAWQGYQRGLWAELTKLAFIVAGFLIGSPDYLGKMMVKAVNGFYMAFQFLFHGGFQAIATGKFNAESLSKIFEEIADIPPPITKDNYELALFLVMLFLIGLGYLVSKLFKKNAWPGLGLVVGAINGFLLSYIFLPLLPDKAPFTLDDFSLAGIIKQIFALASYLIQTVIKIIGAIFNFMTELLGPWTIPVLLLIIVVVTLMSLTRGKKSSQSSQGGSSGGGGGGS